MLDDFIAAGETHAQPVRHQRAAIRNAALEDAGLVHALEFVRRGGFVVFPDLRHRILALLEHPHHGDRLALGARKLVVTQQRAGLVMSGLQQ